MSKICNINFWIENDPHPTPPFGTFPKTHPFWCAHPSLSSQWQALLGTSWEYLWDIFEAYICIVVMIEPPLNLQRKARGGALCSRWQVQATPSFHPRTPLIQLEVGFTLSRI